MLVVCRKLGIENVFRANGPAGVAVGVGFGTETIPQVRKIVAPAAIFANRSNMQRTASLAMMCSAAM